MHGPNEEQLQYCNGTVDIIHVPRKTSTMDKTNPAKRRASKRERVRGREKESARTTINEFCVVKRLRHFLILVRNDGPIKNELHVERSDTHTCWKFGAHCIQQLIHVFWYSRILLKFCVDAVLYTLVSLHRNYIYITRTVDERCQSDTASAAAAAHIFKKMSVYGVA